jgi:hypothetical protein
MVKLLENTFRSVNIGMVNELAQMCDMLGVDVLRSDRCRCNQTLRFHPLLPRSNGIDVDHRKIRRLQAGKSYIGDVSDETVADAIETRQFLQTADFTALRDVDTVSICVPTPLSKSRDPDISFIVSATEQIRNHLHTGQLRSSSFVFRVSDFDISRTTTCGYAGFFVKKYSPQSLQSSRRISYSRTRLLCALCASAVQSPSASHQSLTTIACYLEPMGREAVKRKVYHSEKSSSFSSE